MVPFTLEFNHKLWSCSFKLSCWSWPYWERSGAEKQRRKSRQSLPSQRSTLAWWIVMMLLWPALISGSNSGASEFLCKLLPITLCTLYITLCILHYPLHFALQSYRASEVKLLHIPLPRYRRAVKKCIQSRNLSDTGGVVSPNSIRKTFRSILYLFMFVFGRVLNFMFGCSPNVLLQIVSHCFCLWLFVIVCHCK